jgi:bifunctional non-homologous end joining protein LigD
MPLEKYREKRDADRTPEPFGGSSSATATQSTGMFVVQKHAARRLHYDFRLEMEGVLRSWAIPKGPSADPRDKRLAVMVEDHPIKYGDFEGSIPPGNYGAGSVIVWDRGAYRVIDPPQSDAAQEVRKGKLDIEMHGFKLKGAFTLVRTRGRSGSDGKEQWLLIKKRDEYVSEGDLLAEHPRSVLSGLTIEEMAEASPGRATVAREFEKIDAPRLKAPSQAASFPLTLAKTHDEPFDGDEWVFELKYDGVRALAIRDGQSTRLFGRAHRDITRRYPEVVLALASLPFSHFVLDGELVAPDDQGRPSFQLLQHRMHVEDERDAKRLSLSLPVTYWAFDLLAFGDFDLRSLPLEERKLVLSHIVRGEGPVRYCDHIAARGCDFFHAAENAKLEGIIAKRRRAPYRGVRTDDWVKIKCPRRSNFVIGGWTEPAGTRTHFGALLLGQFEWSGELRFISCVGTGFDEAMLRKLHRLMNARERDKSPFRRLRNEEAAPPRGSHFCEPELVCEVRFGEWTEHGGIRHPVFLGLVADAQVRECRYEGGTSSYNENDDLASDNSSPKPLANADLTKAVRQDAPWSPAAGAAGISPASDRTFKATNLNKVFWPEHGYTKGDLLHYYETIAPWMLPYLQDRPVVLTRYPDGITGKSFFQKDAPAFAPSWIRTERIYADDVHREIAYFILETPEAIAYIANMAAIPIHIWSSRLPHLERPDWLLFDIDPKNSTTEKAVIVARETGAVLREIGMRPYVKTSGQMGIHVVVGLVPEYTYAQARMFSQMVSRVVISRIPEHGTLIRDHAARKGRAYIDYMQLSQGKTIAAPFAVRPIIGAPVSTPTSWEELKLSLDPGQWNIKTVPPRLARLKHDSFLGALTDSQRIETALPALEALLTATASTRG